ncbi:GerAB/ArcD/ProY family transporter [Brevibacillus laterosporus]|uniref:GerAB/ArcD/ProY family transporter n=1 Tax=Brevibacillus laterosporus TaxID=1465 RepID=UPI000EB2C9FA|nr:endospore germination permease [Brevibacillus laterosporus]AYK05628.1 spore gernimation protein [Brevibacillus laterosporus]
MSTFMKKEISLLHFILTITSIEIGTSILTLPAELAQASGTDGWISILIGYVLSTIVSLCIIKVMSKHPGKTMLQILHLYFSSIIGNVMMVIWIIYSFISAFSIFVSSVFIINEWILPNTPNYFISVLFIVPIYMAIRGGIRVLSGFQVVVFFSTLWLLLVLLFPLDQSHFVFLLPILKEGWEPVIQGVRIAVFPFLGFELAYLFYPYIKNKEHAAKGIIIANAITLLIYLEITIICYMVFSPDEITKYIWPTLTLVKPIHFAFLERFEIVYVSFYILIFLSSVIPYLFFVTEGISELTKRRERSQLYIILGIFIVSYLFYHPYFTNINLLNILLAPFSYIVAFAFPVFFWLYVMLVPKRKGT